MGPTGDRAPTEPDRLTVAQAADRLGVSAEAVRSRVRRGTLASVKEGANVYVLLDADRTRPGTDRARDRTNDQAELVEVLRAQLEDLRADRDAWKEQARRNDRIIAGLIERVPELEAPSATDRGTQQGEDAGEAPDKGPAPQEAQAPTSRPWWRRIFGG